MSVYSELAGIQGVIAAGEYAYRGDRYNYKGQLSDVNKHKPEFAGVVDALQSRAFR